MKSHAAVAFGLRQPLENVEIDVVPPYAELGLVKLPTQGYAIPMHLPYRVKPLKGIVSAVLGYKGAGIMVKVGEGVTINEWYT